MKIFSIDLDGTLLTTDHEISKEDLLAIQKAKENGVEIIFNSGRDKEEIIMYKELEALKTPLICMNGTRVYSKEHKLLSDLTMNKEEYLHAMSILTEYDIYIETYTNQGVFSQTEKDMPDFALDKERFILDYKEVAERKDISIYKIITLSDPEALQKPAERIKKSDGVNVFFSYPYCLEVTDKLATKGLAINHYIKLNNLNVEAIYSIGDGGNDLDVFKVSDIAVAMDNAPDYVKNAADFITKNRDESGVAYAIKDILKLI